jgi:hypothetical protein
MKTNVNELLEAPENSGVRFQKDLARIIVENNLQVIVETGSGASTLHILKALEKTGGRLYSIDPEPVCVYEVTHPQYVLIKKRSIEAMADLYTLTGAWDLFLHDSDHDILCQTYEYEMAYKCVIGGGFILSDDYEWNAHFSWAKFIEKNNLKQFLVGNIAAVKNNTEPIDKSKIQSYSKECLKFAKEAERKWLSDGNKNTFDIVYAGTNRIQ